MSADKPLCSGAFRARALLLGARLELRNWPEGETLGHLKRIGALLLMLIVFEILLTLYGMWLL